MREIIFQTDWGWIGIAATDRGVRAVVLPKPTRRAVERELRSVPSNGAGGAATIHLKAAKEALTAYLAGKGRVHGERSLSWQARGGRVRQRLGRVGENGKLQSFHVPLDLQGQPRFRVKVWEVLQSIPYGRVRSYGWVARKVGKPKAARAVGGACGANPVPLLVPCHRVIAGDGSLGGFSGGLSRKKRLLKLEGIYF